MTMLPEAESRKNSDDRDGQDTDSDNLRLEGARNGQFVLDLGHTPSFNEADFIVSQGNERAFAHVMSFPNWSSPLSLIIGPAKAGKTHLGLIWTARAQAMVATSESLQILAREGGTTPILLDDADSSKLLETDLFHLLNQSMRDGRPLLMTARRAPETWQLRTNDVLSRVRLAAQFHVEPADDIQLSQMFVKLFEDRQISVDPKIIKYLVQRMERSPQEAVALVSLMDRLALTRRTAISRSIAAEAIALRTRMHDENIEKVIVKDSPENG